MQEKVRVVASQRLGWHFAGVSILLIAVACNNAEGPQKKGGDRSAVQVEAAAVQRMSVQRQVDLAGTLISPDQAKVSSEVAGVVREVPVQLGQEVAPGQVLVRLDPKELELAVRRAESLLHQTEAQLGINPGTKEPPPDEQLSIIRTAVANRDDARAQLARARRLQAQRLLPQADLDAAETRVKVTEAGYQAALENVQSLKATLQERRAALELANKKLADAVIRAPVGGSISERLVQPGEFIRENTPVVTIVQVNPLKLKTGVQERYASLIKQDLAVRFQVEPFPGVTFQGRIAYISPAVEQQTRTFTVEVLVENPDRRLKPGFFAKGIILTRRDDNVIGVPEDAVSTLAGVSTVFVIQNNRVRQQVISIGIREGSLYEVLGGLKGDEVLATTNLNQLATGVQVETGPISDAKIPVDKPGGFKAADMVREERGGQP